jgi:hypothetical protein
MACRDVILDKAVEHLRLPRTVHKVCFLASTSRSDEDVMLITSAHVTLISPMYHVMWALNRLRNPPHSPSRQKKIYVNPLQPSSLQLLSVIRFLALAAYYSDYRVINNL